MAPRRKYNYPGEPKGLLSRIVWHFHRKRRKRVRKFVLRTLHPVESMADLGRLKYLLLNLVLRNSANLKKMPLGSYADLARLSLELAPKAVSLTEPPCEPRELPQVVETSMPAIRAHLFEAVDAAADSTAIIAGGHIGVPELYFSHASAIISDPKHLLWHSRDGSGIVERSAANPHQSGVMLFAHGSTNWYHWLIENLPAAFLTQGLPDGLGDLPLIVPAEVLEISTFRDSLELFRNGRDVVPLGPGLHHFQRLIVVDSLVREPINLRHGVWPERTDYAFNCNVLQKYRAAILERLDIRAPAQTQRLFLARGNGRRNYNQGELLEVAERHGFRAVYPELLSFRDQVELLAQAAFVIGPSGAAFANALFCQSGTRLLSWLPPEYRSFSSYTNIARVTESSLRYLFTVPDRPLRSTFDAFVTGYHVDGDAFETALRFALESPEY